MIILDTIFGAWFEIVPFNFFVGAMALLIIFNFLYILMSKWDMV